MNGVAFWHLLDDVAGLLVGSDFCDAALVAGARAVVYSSAIASSHPEMVAAMLRALDSYAASGRFEPEVNS